MGSKYMMVGPDRAIRKSTVTAVTDLGRDPDFPGVLIEIDGGEEPILIEDMSFQEVMAVLNDDG